MPLVRYEVRCEHSLANPEVFRSASRDDPEGLLQGVAMAGFIGIIRQLGDLAEFAAEIFCDLHKELTAVGARAHDLTVRVQQLEAGLPAVEKALLSEPNQLRFAYTNGANWHASLPSDQNHCTSSELPRFVRNFYEECRRPPRLSLLDKFDVGGAGTCLKRYSDPSFFKLEWARSELMKTQRAQLDKKARQDKKKGRRRKTGHPIAAVNQIPARVRYGSASLEDLDGLSPLLAPTLKSEVGPSSPDGGASHGHATETKRRSNIGPQNKIVEGPSPPSDVSAPHSKGGASKSLKISAKDIEATVPGRFYRPKEAENVPERMAGKISKIIEMEDREAVLPVGLIPRNVGNKIPMSADGLKRSDSEVEAKGTKRMTTEYLGTAAMGRTENTPETSSNASKVGKGGSNPGNSRVSQSSIPDVSSGENVFLASEKEVNTGESRTPRRVPDDTGVLFPQVSSSITSTTDVRDTVRSSRNVSGRSSADAQVPHVLAAQLSRQDSESSTRVSNDFGITTARSTPEDLSEQVADTTGAVDRHEYSHHGSNFVAAGNQSLPYHNDLANMPDVGHGIDKQWKHETVETPGDGGALGTVDVSEELVLSDLRGEPTFHDVHPSEAQRRSNNVVKTYKVSNNSLEDTVYESPHLSPIRIKEVFTNEEESHVISATSPNISCQWSSRGEEDLRPSVSMLSRLSYSSELMPFSSGSEPESPVSPNSPPFNVLYSPPRSPSKISGFKNESLTGLYVGSFLRTAHHCGYNNPQAEIPVLSSSPRSRLVSPSSREPWADYGDHAGPSRPPPPLPENSSYLKNMQDVSSAESLLYPLPSPPSNPELDLPASSAADDLLYQSIDGLSHLTSPQENGETVHVEPASQRSENPVPLHAGDQFEAISKHIEKVKPSVIYLEAQVRLPSTTSASVQEPSRSSSTSPFRLTDSANVQAFHKSSDNLEPRLSTESRSAGVPSSGPTFNNDLLNSPGRKLEAVPCSAPSQSPTSNPPSSEILMHPASSPLKQTIYIVPLRFFEGDEESVPSSPTGSVIIKDTPSPPASPASNYSESGSEIHEYHPSHDQSKSLMSPR
ncbi:hypothetical protein M758_11G004200 [Ceratodon purpureus]|nr:hypothetical protein M758_11G004200 [Ceratodon purpureus]